MSLEIKLTEDVLNKEDGARSSNAWLPMLEPLKCKNTAAFYEHSGAVGDRSRTAHALGTCQTGLACAWYGNQKS